MISIYPLFKTKPRMPFKLASFLNIRENTLIVKPTRYIKQFNCGAGQSVQLRCGFNSYKNV